MSNDIKPVMEGQAAELMITLNNGSQVTLGEFVSWDSKKQASNLRSPISEETRERMREAQIGHIVTKETRRKIGSKNKGRVKTMEELKKISKTSKVAVMTPKGVFPSINEAAIGCGITVDSFRYRLNNYPSNYYRIKK